MSALIASAAARLPVDITLDEQFTTRAQQRHASRFGMWCWLITELLLFAGLLLIATVLRVMYPASVTLAATHLKFWIGAANTVVLICSSLTMSGAITASRQGLQTLMVRCMLATAALGSLFLVLKGYEYYADFNEHMVPFLACAAVCAGARPRQPAVHQRLLRGHRPARAAPGHRHRHPAGADPAGQPGRLPVAAPEPHRDLRPLLAFHRPGLDHRVSDPLPGEPLVTPDFLRAMRVPLIVFASLLALLGGNLLLGRIAFAGGGFVEAAVAGVMVLLVLLFSMELTTEPPIIRFFGVLGFLWVAIMFGMTLTDYLTR